MNLQQTKQLKDLPHFWTNSIDTKENKGVDHMTLTIYCSHQLRNKTSNLVYQTRRGGWWGSNLRSGVIIIIIFVSLLLWLEREKNNA